MKTNSLKRLLNHNFFIYGMVFISVLQLLNFYNANSLLCLGTFGLTYYMVSMTTKNQGLCLLAANVVSIFLLGCEKSGVLEGFKEGEGEGGEQATASTTTEEVASTEASGEAAEESGGAVSKADIKAAIQKHEEEKHVEAAE